MCAHKEYFDCSGAKMLFLEMLIHNKTITRSCERTAFSFHEKLGPWGFTGVLEMIV